MTPFERLAQREFFGIKLGLDNVRALTAALDHPQLAYRRVIVAGTNGKGSVCAITSRALHAAGHRVGLYTSPHLVHLTERYRVGEQDITVEALAATLDAVFAVEDAVRARGGLAAPATYFELATVTAFELFRRMGVDVAVLEVGLGGRFDATNVAEAPFAAITSIGLDHMTHLGDSVTAIAREKAGVIQPGAQVVIGALPDEADDVVREAAARQRATIIDASADVRADASTRGLDTWATWQTPRSTYGPLPLALRGAHQVANAAVAIRLLETLEASGVRAPQTAIETGLREAVWPGRLHVVTRADAPPVVIDGAHNADGAAALARWLDAVDVRGVTLVTAVMRDKDVAAVLAPLAARASSAIVTQVLPPRGLASHELQQVLANLAPGLSVDAADTPAAALGRALQRRAPILVAGSLFLVGEVLAALRNRDDLP